MLADSGNFEKTAPAPRSVMKRAVALKSPVLMTATPQHHPYSWIAGAAVGGALLASIPFLLDFSILGALAAAELAIAALYLTFSRNNTETWRDLTPGPKTIDGAPLRRLLDQSKG